MNLSVIIPVYNEAENIKCTLQEVLSAAKKIEEIKKIDVIVVDDHSSDRTYEVVTELKDPGVRVLRLSRRSGSHTALRAGIMQAEGDAVLCISADGQDDPFCLRAMLEQLRSGKSVVWALRGDRKAEPWYIRFPAQLFYKMLFSLVKSKENMIDLCRADFFLLDKKITQAINACPERNLSLIHI